MNLGPARRLSREWRWQPSRQLGGGAMDLVRRGGSLHRLCPRSPVSSTAAAHTDRLSGGEGRDGGGAGDLGGGGRADCAAVAGARGRGGVGI